MSGGLKLNAKVSLWWTRSLTDGTLKLELLIQYPNGVMLKGMLHNIVSSVPLEWIASRLPCAEGKHSEYLAGSPE